MVYKNGFGITDKVLENLKDQYNRVMIYNKPSIVLISGGSGEGKTTLMVEAMDYVNSLDGLPPVNLKPKEHIQLTTGADNFFSNFDKCFLKGFHCAGYDEAGEFSKRGSLTKFNRDMLRFFETFRIKKILVFMALVDFTQLDNALFNTRIPRLLLYCKDRGFKDGKIEGHNMENMGWIRANAKKLPAGLEFMAYKRSFPLFYGNFHNLEPERAKQLDFISTEGKEQIHKMMELDKAGYMTIPQMSKGCDRPYRWVQNQLIKFKYKSVRVGKNVLYPPNVFYKLHQISEK